MKKAIVVGATSGIGRQLAVLLVKDNYKVGVTGRRKELLEELKQQFPDNIIPYSYDVTNADNQHELTELSHIIGGCDLLFLSSGVGHLNRPLDYTLEDETNQLNVNAFTEIAGWAFKHFKHQGFGHLAVITSIAGLRGGRAAPAYNASKAYQINYLEGLRQRATRDKGHITITDIRAGFVDTGMAQGDGLFWVAPVEKATKQMFKALKSKKSVVYVTKRWRLIAILFKLLPRFIYNKM